MTLPLLATMGVGSYAGPGWFNAGHRMMRDGALGELDIQELMEDATRIVIADQLEAGIDVLSDGELRRQRFVFEMYGRLEGLVRRPVPRRLGIAGYDMAPQFDSDGTITAPNGLGVVEEFLALRRLAPGARLKVAIPGPLTFADWVHTDADRAGAVIEDLIAIVRAEVAALAAAGADLIQLDEPGLPLLPHGLDAAAAVEVINRTIAGIEATFAVHVCFGNNAGRPGSDRRLSPIADAIDQIAARQLHLEFANREMAEIGLLADWSKNHDIGVGVVDVKNFHLETAEDVARRIRQCLEYMPAERMIVTADCGFSALPRYIARQKLQALVDGAKLVRQELSGGTSGA